MQLRLLFAVGADLQSPAVTGGFPGVSELPAQEAEIRGEVSTGRGNPGQGRRRAELELPSRPRASRRGVPDPVPRGVRAKPDGAARVGRRLSPTGPFVADALRVGRFSFGQGLGGDEPVLLDVTA